MRYHFSSPNEKDASGNSLRGSSVKVLSLHTARMLHENKALQTCVYDVSKHYDYTEYWVIATGSSRLHLKAMAEKLRLMYKQKGYVPYGATSFEEGDGWIIMDYGDVVVHLFLAQKRDYYDLDGLVKSAPSLSFT